jgi:hypothetical protein
LVDGCLLGLFSFPEDLGSPFPGDDGEILKDNTASKMTRLIVSALRTSHWQSLFFISSEEITVPFL